ncbi:PREDICTED: uncharacterized protein LOC105570805, partial [Vollenhovia emeryi]|uniref:uncharacterized protein LOC105570805 n=1 Tax=Vollenhovia emeryi TaxID=411798 RepID=UPI0005F42B1F
PSTSAATVSSVQDISQPSPSAASVDETNKEKKYRRGRLEEIMAKKDAALLKLRKQNLVLRNRIQKMKEKDHNDKYKKALSSIFTEDQITSLLTKSQSVKKWSNETIKRALQLRLVCGTNGYKELIHHGIPLPNIRTLTRRLEFFKFKPGISDPMLEFLQHKKPYFKKEIDLECG